MSPARMSSPASVDTRFATCATAGRPHMPMSPATITAAVWPLGSPVPPPPLLGPDGDEHAVAATSRRSNRCFIAIGQLYHTWYRFATRYIDDISFNEGGQDRSDGPVAAGT